MVCHEKSKSNFFGLDFLFVVSNGIVPWALAVRSKAENIVCHLYVSISILLIDLYFFVLNRYYIYTMIFYANFG